MRYVVDLNGVRSEVLVDGEWKKVGSSPIVFNASKVEHALRNVGGDPGNLSPFHVAIGNVLSKVFKLSLLPFLGNQ